MCVAYWECNGYSCRPTSRELQEKYTLSKELHETKYFLNVELQDKSIL